MTAIAHVTTVHPRHDVRIFEKQCTSLSKDGYRVSLFVADSLGSETKSNIRIIDIGCPKSRFHRIFVKTWDVYFRLKKHNFDILHFHDPELLLVAYLLKIRGFKVIFDSHEEVGAQILNKEYIPAVFRKPISLAYIIFQSVCVKAFDGIVCATERIGETFQDHQNSIVVNNFPKVNFSVCVKRPLKAKPPELCYVGVITRARCAVEMVSSIQLVKQDCKLNLMGKFVESGLAEELKDIDKLKRVNFIPYGNRDEVNNVLARSSVGLCIMKPNSNHIYSMPNKLFEYFEFGLPVIASDFPHWRSIFREINAGILTDSEDTQKIAENIDYLLEDASRMKTFSRNGRRAVEGMLNWQSEYKKLADFYAKLSVLK